MQTSAPNPLVELASKRPPRSLRFWLIGSYLILFAGGYLRFETTYSTLGRLLVVALVIVLVARLAYALWSFNRRIDAHPPTSEDNDAYWAELREQWRARWARLRPRGRAHYVWIMLRVFMPLLIGPFFAILILVGPAQLQFGSAPPMIIRFWSALVAAVLAALPIATVQAARGWDRHVESWREYAPESRLE